MRIILTPEEVLRALQGGAGAFTLPPAPPGRSWTACASVGALSGEPTGEVEFELVNVKDEQ